MKQVDPFVEEVLAAVAVNSRDAIREVYRHRALIFQVDEKEWTAELCALPYPTFYHLSFDAWQEVRRQVEAFTEEAERMFHRRAAQVFEFTHMRGRDTRLWQIWVAYRAFCHRTARATTLDAIRRRFA